MGGNSPTEPTTTAPSGFPGQPYGMTMPAFMPGQLEALAQQLGAAYGGDQLAALKARYAPSQFKAYQPISGLMADPAQMPAPANMPAPTMPATPADMSYPDPYDVSRHFNSRRRT